MQLSCLNASFTFAQRKQIITTYQGTIIQKFVNATCTLSLRQ